jgi:hypothetical protein
LFGCVGGLFQDSREDLAIPLQVSDHSGVGDRADALLGAGAGVRHGAVRLPGNLQGLAQDIHLESGGRQAHSRGHQIDLELLIVPYFNLASTQQVNIAIIFLQTNPFIWSMILI